MASDGPTGVVTRRPMVAGRQHGKGVVAGFAGFLISLFLLFLFFLFVLLLLLLLFFCFSILVSTLHSLTGCLGVR